MHLHRVEIGNFTMHTQHSTPSCSPDGLMLRFDFYSEPQNNCLVERNEYVHYFKIQDVKNVWMLDIVKVILRISAHSINTLQHIYSGTHPNGWNYQVSFH